MALILACEQFLDPDEIVCDCDLPDNVTRDDVADAASDLLVRLSGGFFRGRCESTVRPVFDRCYDCRDYCDGLDRIPLKGPNPEVSVVKIDGATLDASEYRILNHQYLVRTSSDGRPPDRWPRVNKLYLASTEEKTFEVTYEHGPDVSDLVVRRAALEAACDIIAGMAAQRGPIDENVTQATLDGLTVSRTLQFEERAALVEKQGFSWISRFIRLYGAGNSAEIWYEGMNLGWTLEELS